MQKFFREFEELVFFDLWIPDSGIRIPDSGFRFRIPISGFPVLGLPSRPSPYPEPTLPHPGYSLSNYQSIASHDAL